MRTRAYFDLMESPSAVMPALVAGIHVFLSMFLQRKAWMADTPGHDDVKVIQDELNPL